MLQLQDLGRIIIIIGVIIVVVGGLVWFVGKLPFLGKLPGDIIIQKPNFTFYAPLTTGLIISIILSFLLTLFSNIKK